MTTLRLVGGRDVPSPAPDPTYDPTDEFPSVLSPELLGELLQAVPEEVAADALASLAPAVLARVVDKALIRVILAGEATDYLEVGIRVAQDFGELCDRLPGARRARLGTDGAP